MKSVDKKEMQNQIKRDINMTDRELLENAIEVVRRYTTTLGTICVEHGGSFTFNPEYTKPLSGKHVDFEAALMDDGMIKLKLLVDGEYWKEPQQIEETEEE